MHIITNGENYVIYHESDSNFSIDFTESKAEATRFPKAYPAIGVMKRFKNKLYGYYVYDECRKKPEYENRARMVLSYEQRLEIYNRANGKCVLCGKEIKINKMTIDHIIPLSMGGADEMSNMQCTCYACNQFKSNILPEQFEQKIADIFTYQTEKKHGKELRWKIAKKLLQGIV